MLKAQPTDRKKKKFIGKGRRMQIYAWSCLVGAVLLLTGTTYAWYTLVEREAETKETTVMKPYYLNLSNPSETDMLQLSVGSLLQGKTKQIVFCVTGRGEEQINQDTTAFDYALELAHTDNLALKYQLYRLEEANEGESNVIIAEDILVAGDGTTTTQTTYWRKTGVALLGTDISEVRQQETGLRAAGVAIEDIINKGTYTLYGRLQGKDGVMLGVDNGLRLDPGTDSLISQYFVLELSWNVVSGFERYEKETDMIYLLAKALQPKPEKE